MRMGKWFMSSNMWLPHTKETKQDAIFTAKIL
jgi:hypothetical protein